MNKYFFRPGTIYSINKEVWEYFVFPSYKANRLSRPEEDHGFVLWTIIKNVVPHDLESTKVSIFPDNYINFWIGSDVYDFRDKK